jgi:hypothetical protein
VLRSGPSRVAASAATTLAAGPVLAAANQAPPAPVASVDGVSLVASFDTLLATTLQRGAPTGAALQDLAAQGTALAVQAPARLKPSAQNIARLLSTAANTSGAAPYAEVLVLLAAGSIAANPAQLDELTRSLNDLNGRFNKQPPAPKDTLAVVVGLRSTAPSPEPPCAPVDLDALATGIATAFDPTTSTAAMRVRVLSEVGGLDPVQPLAPPEACVGIDRSVWRDVNGAFPEWLLPGVAALADDAVVALQTNPTFVDALLVGLNSQLLNELRWRNIPVATGCTPLRSFWQRSDPTTGERVDDILGVTNWPPVADLGSPDHRPSVIAGPDLVVAVRGRLFLRYPATVVYLTSATVGGTVSFDVDPDPNAIPILPTFQGRIGTDVSFFGFQGFDPIQIGSYWLVFEEPPAGYRFANDASSSSAPEQWAAEAFARPVRVLIRGDRLIPGGA